MRRAFCAAVLLALACLLPRAVRVGMAGGYIDSISRIPAQEEARYGSSAIAMAEHGGWLTPRLHQPPLLIWISAFSAKLFGISRVTLRLPLVMLAALAIGLIFLWGAEAGGLTPGITAGVLVISNHLFHSLATLVMTDALLVVFTTAALYAIYTDPWLESRAALWGYAAATAGAILTAGIAGVLPIAVLMLYWIAVRPRERPSPARTALAVGLSLALAAPWFLYQLAVHARWFDAAAPPPISQENPVVFYLLRLAATDPILFAAAVVAIPAFVRLLPKRSAGPTLLACWLALAIAASAWQVRNAAGLLELVPAMALIAACHGPFSERRHASWMLAFVCAGMLIKAALPDATWGLNYRAGTINPVAPALSACCAGAQPQSLIVVDAVDDLDASLLPIDLQAVSGYAMPFRESGIILTAGEHAGLAQAQRHYRPRPREWGEDSVAPVRTLITVASPGEPDALVNATPADFLIPERYRAAIHSPQHRLVPAGQSFWFLLSTAPAEGQPAARAHLPDVAAPNPSACRGGNPECT